MTPVPHPIRGRDQLCAGLPGSVLLFPFLHASAGAFALGVPSAAWALILSWPAKVLLSFQQVYVGKDFFMRA